MDRPAVPQAGASRSRSPGRSVTARIVAATSVCAILGVIPLNLTGALAVFIRRDLGFTESALGLAVSGFYVSSTLTSVVAGRASERMGARRTLTTAIALSGLTLLGIASLTRSWWHLAALLVLGGVANAVAQPATNMALTRLIPPARQGLAFGLKQASAPTATLCAGLAVPVLGVALGWRWGFALAATLPVAFLVLLPRRGVLASRVNPRREAPQASTGSLLLLSFAVSLAVATASALGAFFVESAVAQGWSPAVAGSWMAVGSVVSILVRVLLGWQADRWGPRLEVVSALMFTGALGLFLLGRVTSAAALGIGSVVSFAFGWGWPGLFQFAAVRRREHAPGHATGVVMIGMFLGGVYGPSTFGALVERQSYAVAWTAAAAAMAAGGALVLVGRAVIDSRSLPPRP